MQRPPASTDAPRMGRSRGGARGEGRGTWAAAMLEEHRRRQQRTKVRGMALPSVAAIVRGGAPLRAGPTPDSRRRLRADFARPSRRLRAGFAKKRLERGRLDGASALERAAKRVDRRHASVFAPTSHGSRADFARASGRTSQFARTEEQTVVFPRRLRAGIRVNFAQASRRNALEREGSTALPPSSAPAARSAVETPRFAGAAPSTGAAPSN